MAWWIILIIALAAAAIIGSILYAVTVRELTKKYFTRHRFSETTSKHNRKKIVADDSGYRAFMHEAVKTFSEVPFERMEVKSVDGLNLVGRLYAAENADKTVICIHGYCGTGIRDMSAIAPFFIKNGFNVLLVDNRAHGESEGNVIGYGVLDSLDIAVWINALKTARPVKSTFLYGISMGAATAMMTAQYVRREEVAGIIADCGYTSIYEQMRFMLRTLTLVPPALIVPAIRSRAKKFAGYDIKTTDTREILAKTDIPVLFVHGSEDKFVPPAMTEQNARACASAHDVLIVKDAKHAESYFLGREAYEKRVLAFTANCTEYRA